MNLMIIGCGAVGSAVARIASRRRFLQRLVVADVDLLKAQQVAAGAAEGGLARTAVRIDAADTAEVERLLRAHRVDAVVNACDPRFNPPIFDAAERAGVVYLDMAMHLSEPHAERPYELLGRPLGEAQLAAADRWAAKGKLAIVGMGVEPGMSDVFARYAADHLFSRIDEIGVRDGGNLVIDGHGFAPTFSIWTTIEECLNPPVIWERGRGWYTTEPFSEPEVFDFPEGIGPLECVNVEHEEVLLMPRWIDVGRVTFKYGLGREFIEVLKTLRLIASTRHERSASVASRSRRVTCWPRPCRTPPSSATE